MHEERDAAGEPGSVVEEVERGRSWRTPFLAIGGVWLLIALVFAIAVGLAALAYALA